MKKTILLLVCTALFSCGGSSDKKKEGFQYNRVKKEKASTQAAKGSVPVDLSNEGIGPIANFKFPNSIDEAMAAEGATIFKQKCTACHKPNAKLIGPAMQGIYERRNPTWVMNILLNPTEMLKKDPIAKALLAEYNNILMINQNLSEEEARKLAEYFRTL